MINPHAAGVAICALLIRKLSPASRPVAPGATISRRQDAVRAASLRFVASLRFPAELFRQM
jgi:hypothetical protein